jgi:hypothetical protein
MIHIKIIVKYTVGVDVETEKTESNIMTEMERREWLNTVKANVY